MLLPTDMEDTTSPAATIPITTSAITSPDSTTLGSTEAATMRTGFTDFESTGSGITGPESTNPEFTITESTNPGSTGPKSTDFETTSVGSTDSVFTSASTSISTLVSSSESVSTMTEATPSSQPSKPVYVAVTFEGLTEEQFVSEGLMEELIIILKNVLKLDADPEVSIQVEGSSIVVQVNFGRNEENTNALALQLLASIDSQWLTFRNAYVGRLIVDRSCWCHSFTSYIFQNVTTIGVVVAPASSEIPWWHWLIIAVVAANVMGATILLTVAVSSLFLG